MGNTVVFASPHGFEIDAFMQALHAEGIPSVWLQGQAVRDMGLELEAGARYEAMVHVVVADEFASRAHEVLRGMGFATGRSGAPRITAAEVRRGQRALVIVALLALLTMIAGVLFDNTSLQRSFRAWLLSLFS